MLCFLNLHHTKISSVILLGFRNCYSNLLLVLGYLLLGFRKIFQFCDRSTSTLLHVICLRCVEVAVDVKKKSFSVHQFAVDVKNYVNYI